MWVAWLGFGVFLLSFPEGRGYGWIVIAFWAAAACYHSGYREGEKEGDRIGATRVLGQWHRERMDLVKKGELAPETMWEWAEYHSMHGDAKPQD